MLKVGDKIRYKDDHSGMKGKLGYIIHFMNYGEVLVESEMSGQYPGSSRSSMEDFLDDNRLDKQAALKALKEYKEKIGGRFCYMGIDNIEFVPESTEPTRNETYLFPDIKDLK